MKQQKIFVCDFETTVYDGQKFTEVWAAACVEMGTENVSIFHSIDEQYKFFLSFGTVAFAKTCGSSFIIEHNSDNDVSFFLTIDAI